MEKAKNRIENAEDLAKKMFYTGVGLVSLAVEKMQETLDQLSGDQENAKEEGQKIFDDLMKKVEDKREELESRFKESTGSVTDSIKLPVVLSRDEYDALLTRLDALEAKIDKGGSAAQKKTSARVKKVVAETKASE